MKIKASAVQMEIENLDTEKNLKKAEKFAFEAAEKHGSHFLCYPELFITGALTNESISLAQTVPGPYTDYFCDLASKLGIHIIMGSVTEKEGDKYYNTSVLIDDNGSIAGKYRKIHLWCGEKIFNTPGDSPGIFETKWGTVGIEICWDLAFPELSKQMALAGAKMVFCPTLWSHDDKYSYINYQKDADSLKAQLPDIDTEEIYIDTCVAARAIENNIAFMLVNGCGKTKIHRTMHTLVGHSQIALPFYGKWNSLSSEEGLLTAEIDLELLALAETTYNTLKDSRL